jgi:hypothetical protein
MNNALSQWFNAATSATASASSEWEQNDIRYHAARAIDRQVELGRDTAMWISAPSQDASLHLKWETPIVVREIVLYPISKKSVIVPPITVKKAQITLFSDSKLVKTIAVDTLLAARLQVGEIPINELNVKLASDSISHLGLGEIEVIARLPYSF